MAVQIIDTLTDNETPFYEQRTSLEDKDYLFTFYWNPRRNVWTFDLQTLAGTPIIAGQTIRCDTDLLRRSTSAEKPPGLLTAISYTTNKTSPGFVDLGGRVQLAYFTSDDAVLNAS